MIGEELPSKGNPDYSCGSVVASTPVTVEDRFQASEIVAGLRKQSEMREIAKKIGLPLPYCYFAYSMNNRTRWRMPDRQPYADRYLCPVWAIRKILAFGKEEQ